jgi:hypothetical protein
MAQIPISPSQSTYVCCKIPCSTKSIEMTSLSLSSTLHPSSLTSCDIISHISPQPLSNVIIIPHPTTCLTTLASYPSYRSSLTVSDLSSYYPSLTVNCNTYHDLTSSVNQQHQHYLHTLCSSNSLLQNDYLSKKSQTIDDRWDQDKSKIKTNFNL